MAIITSAISGAYGPVALTGSLLMSGSTSGSEGTTSGSEGTIIHLGSGSSVTVSISGTLLSSYALTSSTSASAGITTYSGSDGYTTVSYSGSFTSGAYGTTEISGGLITVSASSPGLILYTADLFVDGTISGSGVSTFASSVSSSGDVAVTGAIHATQFYGGGAGLTGVTAAAPTSLSGTTAQLTTGVETSGYLKVSGSSTFDGVATHTAHPIFDSGITIKNADASAGYINFFEQSSNGTNVCTFRGKSSIGNITITLPGDTGTVVLEDNTVTLSNKTLTSPIITGGISGSGTIRLADSLSGSADIAVTGAVHAAQFYGGGAGLTGVTAAAPTSLSGTTAQLTTGVETSGYLKVSGSSTFGGDITAFCDTVTIESPNSTDPVLILKNTNTDANGARLRFVKDAGEAGAASDVSGLIEFYADDANQDQVLFAQIEGAVEVATNGQEGGKLTLGVASNDGEMNVGLLLKDGDAEDEIDVIVGNTTTSLTSVAGVLKVGGNVIQASDGGTTITMDTSDNVTVAGGVTAAGLTSTAAISGSSILYAAGPATFSSTIASTGSITGNGVTSFGGFTMSSGHYSGSGDFHTVGHVTLGGNLTASGSVSGNGLTSFADLEVGGGDIALGNGQDGTFSITNAAGTNTAGRSLTISAGNGTGTGAPGLMTLKVPKPGTSGDVVHTSVTIVECMPEGMNVHWNQAHNSANDTGVGDIVYFGTGTTTAGKMYYLHSGSGWSDASCTLAASGGIGILGIAIGTNPASNGMLVRGFYDVHSYLSGTFTVGRPVYLTGAPPAAGGKVGINQPSGSGEIVRIVGHCTTTANVIYFNPSSEYIELA